MKWFRFYTEALHDPKVQRLSPALFKTWVNLLCLANDQEDRGALPSTEDIAFALRVPFAKAVQMISELAEAGLIDAPDGEQLLMHGWNKRQPASDNAAERMANTRRTSSEHVPPRGEKKRTEENRSEKEREEDTEEEVDQSAFAQIRSHLRRAGFSVSDQDLSKALASNGRECIEHCVNEAVTYNRPSWAYTNEILKTHYAHGCPTEPMTRREKLIAGGSR